MSLLEKEMEFRKINDELEMRTKELLQEVNTVLRIQDNLLTESTAPIKPERHSQKNHDKHSYTIAQDRTKTEEELSSSNPDHMGVKGMNHFLRAKLKAVQEDCNKLHNEYKNKNEEVKKFQKEICTLNEEKTKWFQLANSNKNIMNKLENQVTSISSKLQSKENENMALRKEVEQLKKDLKNANLSFSATEVRLNRAKEEIEKVQGALKSAKQEEKDTRESYRKQINELTSVLKRIEKQKLELLDGFKKQLQLVDNLRRQKAHLEAYKATELSETEFTKILNWKTAGEE